MPNVVRFALPTARDQYLSGVGFFRDGILDVDANRLDLVQRARYLAQPYRVVEIGIVDSSTPPPTLPAEPAPPAADPYPMYLTDAEAAAQLAAGTGLVGAAAKGALVPRPTGGADGQTLIKQGADVVWGAAGLTAEQIADDATVKASAVAAAVDAVADPEGALRAVIADGFVGKGLLTIEVDPALFKGDPALAIVCNLEIQEALDEAALADGPATVLLPAGYGKVTGLVVYDDTLVEGHGDRTALVLTGSSNENLLRSSHYGHATAWNRGIVLRDFRLIGNKANQSPTLHPQAHLVADAPTQPTVLYVDSTAGFPDSGALWVGAASVTYTGKQATQFTGVQIAREVGNIRKGAWVTPVDSKGHLVAIQGRRCRLENLLGVDAAGSGIYIQGPYHGTYQPENILQNLRMEGCNRFGYEIGENASDGQTSKLVTGPGNRMGAALVRSVNWTFGDFHPTGVSETFDQVGPAVICAVSELRMINFYPDTYPGSSVVVDAFVRGGQRIGGPKFAHGRTFRCGLAGGSAVLFRGPGAGGSAISRVTLDDMDMWAPFDWVISNGPATVLVGGHDLTAPPSGKVQVKSALDFQPSSAIGGPVNIGSDVIAYTGRQMSGTYAGASGAATGATSLDVASTTGFDNAGTIVVTTTANNGLSFVSQVLTYTGKTATSFTGIPASGAGSIATAIVGGSSTVSQHFLTGVTGGATASVAAFAKVTSAAQTPLVGELQVVVPAFRSYLRGRFNMQPGDDWQLIGGVSGGKKMRSSGTLSVAAGATTATVAHDMPEAPTTVQLTPTADTQGRRYWITKSATNVTVTLDSATVTSPITFDWTATITT